MSVALGVFSSIPFPPVANAIEYSTEDLVCLHLLAADDGTSGSGGVSTRSVLDALGVGEGALAGHFSVISGLSRLADRGLVASRRESGDAGDGDGGRTVYGLTEAGRDHAHEVASRLADREVTVQSADGTDVTTLGEATDRLGCSLADAVARLHGDVLLEDDTESPVYRESSGDTGSSVGAESPADAQSIPFVDRTDELARLESRYEAAASGADPLLIDGEPGVGKTHLTSEFGERVAERGGQFLSGQCPPETDTPYEPFLDAVRDLPTADRDRLTTPLTATDGGEESARDRDSTDQADPSTSDTPGSRVVPEEPGSPAAPADPVSPADLSDPDVLERRRQSLFDAVATELAELTGERPVVLALDDVQRLDRPTALLVAHLASELADESFLVVGTVSPTVADPTATLEDALAAYGLAATHLTLGPFDRAATGTLVHRLLGTRRVPEQFVDGVYDHTGGNPLFVTESVDRLFETGLVRPGANVYPESAADLPVPDTVEAAITTRLATLDDGTRELVDLAGLVGGAVPAGVLAAASTLPRGAVEDRVDLLVGSRLWERDDEGRVTFVSDLVRETVSAALDEERRRTLHSRLATAFQDVGEGAGEYTAAAAYHYDRAEETEAALDASLAAAEHATSVFAHEVAIEACERAVTIARDAGNDARVVEALELLGDTYRVTGEYGEAARCYRYVRDRAEDPETVQRAYRTEAVVEINQGAFDAAETLLERGLDVAHEAGDSRSEGRLRGLLGRIETKRGEFDAAREQFEASLDLAREAGDRRGEARRLGDLGRVADKQGRFDEAEDLLERARESFRDLGDRRGEARTQGTLGRVAEKRGDFETAREYHQASLAVYRDIGDPRGEAGRLVELGAVERKQSNFAEAREYHQGGLDIYRRLGDRHGQAKSLGNLGSIAQMDCEFAAARERFQRSLEIKRDLGDRHGQARSLGNLGLVADEVGRFGAAREYLGECLDIFREVGDRHGEAKALYLLGLTTERAGDLDDAREYLRDGLELERELGDRRGEAKAVGMLGQVERAEGNLGAARERHETALELYRDLDNPLAEAESLLNLGLVDLETDGGTGRALFEDALDEFADVDDPAGTQRCRALLGAAEIREGDTAGREKLDEALSYLGPAGVTPAALEVCRRHIEAELACGDADRASELCERARDLIDGTDAELGAERDRVTRLCERFER